MPEAMHGAMLDGCLEQSTQRTQQTQRTQRLQDQAEKGRVSYQPTPVDKRDSRVDEVQSMTDQVSVSRSDVLRTRVTLAGLQARQEQLRDSVNRSGLSSTTDRLDFLIAQRSPDEALAWNRSWRALGITRPEPTVEVFARPESLSVPYKPRTQRRKKSDPVIPRDRQLEIALAVMASKEARVGGKQVAA